MTDRQKIDIKARVRERLAAQGVIYNAKARFTPFMRLRILIAHKAVALVDGEYVLVSQVRFACRSASEKLRRLKAMGCMVKCAGPLCGGAWVMLTEVAFDHHLAKIFGGQNHQRNGRPLCAVCHAPKSAAEHTANRKCVRIAAEHFGISKAERPSFKRCWGSRKLQSRPFPPRFVPIQGGRA